MITRFLRQQPTSLRSARNSRPRIYVPGSDPIFGRAAADGRTRLIPTFWTSGFQGRLPLNLSRRPE
ncbi:MAG TPA: hypothetical protein VHE13_09360 [Opitutus sp.]|nr:hypothetical protein [Opitutus sp.]